MTITTVFGGGVHGVGKSTMFEKAAQLRGGRHLIASGLIRAMKADAVSDRTKVAADVAGNQDLLVQGFFKATSNFNGLILLDGHFTLIDKSRNVVAVPLMTFEKLNLQMLVCFKDDPSAIYRRLLQRDGFAPTIQEIQAHQDLELSAAEATASHLRVALHLLNSGDIDKLNALIADTVDKKI